MYTRTTKYVRYMVNILIYHNHIILCKYKHNCRIRGGGLSRHTATSDSDPSEAPVLAITWKKKFG